MFENEIAINSLQIGYLKKVTADLSPDVWFHPGAGHGHNPAWIVGHLTLVGEFGQKLLGGQVTHPTWGPVFGPGSAGTVEADAAYEKDSLVPLLESTYQQFRDMAAQASPDVLRPPHGIEFFQNGPIQTVGHAVALLLTNHFAFHLSQLSSCRRQQGHSALF